MGKVLHDAAFPLRAQGPPDSRDGNFCLVCAEQEFIVVPSGPACHLSAMMMVS